MISFPVLSLGLASIITLSTSTSTSFLCHAFVSTPSPTTSTKRVFSVSSTSLQRLNLYSNSNNNNNNNDNNDVLARNKARTDIRNFLTQRSIQSFIYLLNSMRDPHTIHWMEQVLGFERLADFHGTGAFNITKHSTWDSILIDMLNRPKESLVVSTVRGGPGRGGWSKDNPYLQESKFEYEIDISPPSLVRRILSVREQVASEWQRDLAVMIQTNDEVLRSYEQQQRQSQKSDVNNKENDNDGSSSSSSSNSVYSKISTSDLLDRNSMYTLMKSEPIASSPLRKASLDLLVLLATQESIHRTLRSYSQTTNRSVSFEWLRNYYVDRVSKYFDGHQVYGRADEFLQELINTAPSMVFAQGNDKNKQVPSLSSSSNNEMKLIDPLRMVQDIVAQRSIVAKEWLDLIQTTSSDHSELRNLVFIAQMENNFISDYNDATIVESEGTTTTKPNKKKDDYYGTNTQSSMEQFLASQGSSVETESTTSVPFFNLPPISPQEPQTLQGSESAPTSKNNKKLKRDDTILASNKAGLESLDTTDKKKDQESKKSTGPPVVPFFATKVEPKQQQVSSSRASSHIGNKNNLSPTEEEESLDSTTTTTATTATATSSSKKSSEVKESFIQDILAIFFGRNNKISIGDLVDEKEVNAENLQEEKQNKSKQPNIVEQDVVLMNDPFSNLSDDIGAFE